MEQTVSPAPVPPARKPGRLQWAVVLIPLLLTVAGVISSRNNRPGGLTDAMQWLRDGYREGDTILLLNVDPQDATLLLPGMPFQLVTPNASVPPGAGPWVWIVDARAERGPTQIGGAGALKRTREVYGVKVSLHRTEAQSNVRLDEATRVTFSRAGGQEDTCVRGNDGVYQCPLEAWQKVGVVNIVVKGTQARCIHAHPAAGGILKLAFPKRAYPAVWPLRTALADSAGPVPPVKVEVRADGVKVAEFQHASSPGWEDHPVNLPGNGAGNLAVELWFSVAQGGRHHFCFSDVP